jgi:hypothetical protein
MPSHYGTPTSNANAAHPLPRRGTRLPGATRAAAAGIADHRKLSTRVGGDFLEQSGSAVSIGPRTDSTGNRLD